MVRELQERDTVNNWCVESGEESQCRQTGKDTQSEFLLHLLSMKTASSFCTPADGEAQNQPTFRQTSLPCRHDSRERQQMAT